MSHEEYMKRCFELAKKAKGMVSPNPMVGAVIIKNDQIIGEGFHKKSGSAHAEINAIENASASLKGATLYCNLEPCCHTNKKTPPCAQRIIREGISKVIISNLDPNEHVAGKGIKLLKENGIEVITGICKEEGEILNEVFFTHITKKRPFVHLKWAQTLDGKIATTSKDSKWISSETSRLNVHLERELYDGILVGAGTLINDDPTLSIRLDGKEKVKRRIVLAKESLDTSKYKLFNDENKSKSILISYNQKLDLKDTLNTLYLDHGITSLYVEGGAKTLTHFLEAGLYDKISVYIAPKILGEGISPMENKNSEKINDSFSFKDINWMNIENDILMTAYKG